MSRKAKNQEREFAHDRELLGSGISELGAGLTLLAFLIALALFALFAFLIALALFALFAVLLSEGLTAAFRLLAPTPTGPNGESPIGLSWGLYSSVHVPLRAWDRR
jgi:uncharacterized membrane protein